MPVFRVILASALAFASLLAPDFVCADDKSPSATAAQKVILGSPDLTAGISGSGHLSAAQIQAWLADPKNHQPLQVELPLGLASGKSSIQIPADNPLTRAKIELGRQLYFDPRLSVDSTESCAICHNPAEGYTAHTRTGVGIRGQMGGRNSPVSC